jgi:hypothetical protein
MALFFSQTVRPARIRHTLRAVCTSELHRGIHGFSGEVPDLVRGPPAESASARATIDMSRLFSKTVHPARNRRMLRAASACALCCGMRSFSGEVPDLARGRPAGAHLRESHRTCRGFSPERCVLLGFRARHVLRVRLRCVALPTVSRARSPIAREVDQQRAHQLAAAVTWPHFSPERCVLLGFGARFVLRAHVHCVVACAVSRARSPISREVDRQGHISASLVGHGRTFLQNGVSCWDSANAACCRHARAASWHARFLVRGSRSHERPIDKVRIFA